ncbi:3-hydroxymyristoyl/3-hydroxydecanoyl-(acyl carrier protein) dehydratase [Azospirillum agricola]|uniref:hotdog domain-containing protein n=1 Tax=Azospirillum agricola TaxID=1720247 RepID=UPI001AEABC7E|nr:hotdog domain-containing protein [Azospirillum agricola]MBP2229540.1 3-hydroxymyristoyl/3-hydroxydecanoyl-(acyl carrier protein) dehydratase [Azospirillum agricola]
MPTPQTILRATDLRFPADHPTAAGHFPGNPVIPGAVLLDAALTAIAGAEGRDLGPCRLRSAKFLRPVRPGDRLRIEWQPASAGEIAFTGSVEGRPVMSGRVAL